MNLRRNILLAISLACVTGAALLAVRSYATLDELSRVGSGGVTESIVSFRGALHVARGGALAARRGWSWDQYRVAPGSDWDVLYSSGSVKFRQMGFGWMQGKPFGGARPFGNVKSVPLTPWLNVPPYNAVVVPYWFVALVLAAPWWWCFALRPLLARLRPIPGACRRCGYDLRATPDRCPECGHVPRGKPAVASGLGFSPDEKKLSIADSGTPQNIRVFDVQPEDTLAKGHVFCTIDNGVPHGIGCDEKGNVWSSAGEAVQVFAPDGKPIGLLPVHRSPANLCLGGADGKTLFFTAQTSLCAIRTNVSSAERP